MSNRSLDWSQVDVFAEAPFQGNQLAVFHDASDLSTEQMQTLARETNLSETTFILPRDPREEAEQGIDVRIFTVQEELPFAGHPTLGTASWLYWNHPILKGASEIKLRVKAGTIPVRFSPDNNPGIYGEMTQRNPEFLKSLDGAACAEALSLPSDHLHPTLAPQIVSTGMPIAIVPLRSVDALKRLSITPAKAMSYLRAQGANFAYCIAPTDDPTRWRARLQFYNGEDAATGSACGCTIAYLVRNHAVPGATAITVEQGIEINRPSRLTAQATLAVEENVVDVRVGGRTILAASGRFFLS
ncbi:MAG: PhzF family phenazine biosynthesis protein [Acidobacteria bacterium]|nr:PhzF family phenazine biosynthesis protein [Acidobacteriota bacterium]